MAKANAVSGTTYYVAEGAPVPDELHPDVRLVGPGAPVPAAEPETAAAEPEAASVPVRPNVNASKADWVAYAVAVDEALGQLGAEALSKPQLVERYGR